MKEVWREGKNDLVGEEGEETPGLISLRKESP